MAATTRGRWASPDRTIVWTEPPPKTIPIPTTTTSSRAPPQPAHSTTKVPVVYYLSRNGQLDHPHFMEVPLSDPARGLCLRDVLLRLTALRGDAMPAAYSWSSKRSYRNGYVWHDLTSEDVVLPAHGSEYVLKGSERFGIGAGGDHPRPRDGSATSSSSSSSAGCQMHQDSSKGRLGCRTAARQGRKNWSSFDLGEYRVAVRDDGDDLCAADAATQTEDHRRTQRPRVPAELTTETELGIDEISPPPSSSSPDTLETLIKNDARVTAAAAAATTSRAAEEAVGVIAGGRMRASAVLMQLISCGSVTVKQQPPPPPRRFPRGRSDLSYTYTAAGDDSGSVSTVSSNINMEREYFSGSLVEATTKKTTTPSSIRGGHAELKRSSSYNADRCSSRGGVVTNTSTRAAFTQEQEQEEEDQRTRCIPRRHSKPINHQDYSS